MNIFIIDAGVSQTFWKIAKSEKYWYIWNLKNIFIFLIVFSYLEKFENGKTWRVWGYLKLITKYLHFFLEKIKNLKNVNTFIIDFEISSKLSKIRNLEKYIFENFHELQNLINIHVFIFDFEISADILKNLKSMNIFIIDFEISSNIWKNRNILKIWIYL